MIPIVATIGTMLAEKGLSALGSFISNGADKALDIVSEKTGISLKTIKELTPEQELALRQFEASEDFKRLQLNFENEKLKAQVTVNAQDMQKTALAQDDVFSKRFVYIFAAIWSLFAMIFILAIIFFEIPKENIRFADTILGFLLGTVISAIIQFFYGSSLGSKRATEALINTK